MVDVAYSAISISTLAAVLGLQDLLKSILGGVFVILDQPYSVGDHILLDAAEGEIMAVHLRTTIIRSADGHQISLPNSIVLTTALHNFDRVLESDTVVRVSGVRASRDLTQARLESLLSEEPAIAGKVIVALTAPPRARTLFTRWRTPSTHQSAVERDATADLHITLLLPQPPGSHPSEDEAVRRLRAEFPDASLTVRHGSTRQ